MVTIDSPFSRETAPLNSRAVKSSPDFVALREGVLQFIWTEDGETEPAELESV